MNVFYLQPGRSATASALADAAAERGMSVIDLGGPADVVPRRAHAWGGPLFMARLAAVANIVTLEPTDD